MNGGYIILDRKLSDDIVKNIGNPGEHTFTGVFDIIINAVKIGKNLMIATDAAGFCCGFTIGKSTIGSGVSTTVVSINIGYTQITVMESNKNSYTITDLLGG